LATFLPIHPSRLPHALGASAIALALLALGYTQGALGVYASLTAIWPTWLPISFLYAAAAATLIVAAETWRGMRRALSRPWGRLCGELSFPFYLVHVPALCSAGAYTFLMTHSAPAAIAATLVVSLAAASALAVFSRWWLARLNLAVGALLGRRARSALGPIASSP
jgi:peptidoglycan/LPS O-acetylase OafA/YrhL